MPPPPELTSAYLAESYDKDIYVAVGTVSMLCTMAVILRIISRRLARTCLWWDDYFIIAALAVECKFVAMSYTPGCTEQ